MHNPEQDAPAHNPRVRKSEALRRTAQVSVGVTASEKRRIIAAAEASERSFSDFVREELLRAAARVENQSARD